MCWTLSNKTISVLQWIILAPFWFVFSTSREIQKCNGFNFKLLLHLILAFYNVLHLNLLQVAFRAFLLPIYWIVSLHLQVLDTHWLAETRNELRWYEICSCNLLLHIFYWMTWGLILTEKGHWQVQGGHDFFLFFFFPVIKHEI